MLTLSRQKRIEHFSHVDGIFTTDKTYLEHMPEYQNTYESIQYVALQFI